MLARAARGVWRNTPHGLDFIKFGNSANDVEHDTPFEPKTAKVMASWSDTLSLAVVAIENASTV